MEGRFLKIVLAACPRLGAGSFSWRLKEALEAQGHGVFLFCPSLQPWLFEGQQVRREGLRRFLEVQGPDLMLFGDGLLPDEPAERWGLPLGIAWEAPGPLAGREGQLRQAGFAFALAAGPRAAAFLEGEAVAQRVVECAAVPDRAYGETPLANDIAFAPGMLCLQDATEERVAKLRELMARPPFEGLALRCAGEGWPQEWALDVASPSSAQAIYAFRSSVACLAFDDGAPVADGLMTDFARGLMAADGCPVLMADEAACAPGLPLGEGCEAPVAGAALDEELQRGLARLVAALEAEGHRLGSPSRRRVATVLGYFGKGNFGDEYILQTLDERLRAWHEGSLVVAVSEDPAHTLSRRGIYAIGLRDKAALDRSLAFSAVALVVAGLLFDQGIRWTMGKAEIASPLRYSDIPGIAAFCLLASMNDADVVFYGIGAGPLEVPDSQALVRLIGRTDALFLARDGATAQLLRRCGIAEDRALAKADTAFLGGAPHDDGAVGRWLAEAGFDPSSQRLVAVSLREYENLPPRFEQRVAQALDAVAGSHPEARFAFCVLDPSDRALAERIMASMAARDAARLFDPGDRLDRLRVLLSQASLGLSMRYHCALILNSCDVPCVGLGYLPKVESLFEDMGCEGLLLPMDAGPEAMEGALRSVLDDREAWRQVVAERAAALRELSLEAERLLRERIDRRGPGKEGLVPQALFLRACSVAEGEDQAERSSLERQRDEQRRRAERAERERDELLASRTFRLGDALLRLPRAALRALRPDRP